MEQCHCGNNKETCKECNILDEAELKLANILTGWLDEYEKKGAPRKELLSLLEFFTPREKPPRYPQ